MAELAETDPEAAKVLAWDWMGLQARPNQTLPPGTWQNLMLMAGRGFGKTRTGAEIVRHWAETMPAGTRIALTGRTARDVRDVMVEGESGLINVCPPWNRPKYEPSKSRVIWKNGTTAHTYSGDEPNVLRGPQHHKAWCDELAAWRYPEAWDQLQFGMRLGDDPQCVITTTPRPIALVRELIKDPNTITVRGSTYANAANLAKTFLSKIIKKYEGTRLGRQELMAELLDDIPGALWTRAILDKHRVAAVYSSTGELVTAAHPPLVRVVVAIDPAATSEEGSDDTGIVAGGVAADGQVYILDDASCHETPLGWAREAARVWAKNRGDCIVAEKNNGGDMVESTIRAVDKNLPVKLVWASKGKMTRAEPVSALYQQGKVHHVGAFAELEDQMCTYVPGLTEKSPDRMDALVWCVTELALQDTYEGPRARSVDDD